MMNADTSSILNTDCRQRASKSQAVVWFSRTCPHLSVNSLSWRQGQRKQGLLGKHPGHQETFFFHLLQADLQLQQYPQRASFYKSR